ncbi:MAG: hypothetical protein RTV41_05990 [Candidatus Thorarchaeota archaeon]
MGEISHEYSGDEGPSISRNMMIVIVLVMIIFAIVTYVFIQLIPQMLEEFSPYDFVAEINSRPL